VDINLPYVDYGYRISFFSGTRSTRLKASTRITGKRIGVLDERRHFFPANLYLAPKDIMQQVLYEIQDELASQVTYFKKRGKIYRSPAVGRTGELRCGDDPGTWLLQWGWKNYSRFSFDRRSPGTRPFWPARLFSRKTSFACWMKSHQTVPQISGMYGGDRSRKLVLVDYGFRLPSALGQPPPELP